MARRPLRRPARAAIAVLALVLAFVQTAWAGAAVCTAAEDAHAACNCCKERHAAPEPVIAADCCAVEETAAHESDAPVPGATPRLLVADAPGRAAADVAPVAAPAVVRGAPSDVEVRAAGPPLWLRTRSLRL